MEKKLKLRCSYRISSRGVIDMKKFLSIVLICLALGGMVFAQAKKGPTLRNRDPDTLVFVLAAAPQPLDPNIYTTLNEAQIMREINETLVGMKSDNTFLSGVSRDDSNDSEWACFQRRFCLHD